MSDTHRPEPSDPLREFEAALRRENETIHPKESFEARLAARLAQAKSESLNAGSGTREHNRWRIHRRLLLPLAAVLALGLTVPMLVPTGPQHGARIAGGPTPDHPPTPTSDHQPRDDRRSSVVLTGDRPAIARELPTERPDVTIVWVYDTPRQPAAEEPGSDPVGSLPFSNSERTGITS